MLKQRKDHQIKKTPICGEIIEMLTREENARISIAMAIDIEFTRAHFHRNFEEIYIVLDGWIKLQLYDPGMEKFSECTLLADELLVIAPGVHHKISSASEKNRISIICLPGFDPNDEHLSEII